jgi:pseudouridine-5'-phosphate glycosidase
MSSKGIEQRSGIAHLGGSGGPTHGRSPVLQVAPAVARALEAHEPVVALETAVLTHGLPRPANLAAALEVRDAVTEAGALSATIAVVDGAVRVGLDDDGLSALAADTAARKCSLRDLALAVAGGGSGGTTVAATVVAAHAAGIGVFATGGIGGVHRGSPEDISADLPVLGAYPLVVVCAGPKSLLDLPRTLEVLETHGVPVLGWRCERMPAFYVADSGLPVTARVESAAEVAAIAAARDALGLRHALLVTVPLPEALALAAAEVEDAVALAHDEAAEAGLHGAALTPFVLGRVVSLTDGRSLAANRALLVRNARVAAEIALAMLARHSTSYR